MANPFEFYDAEYVAELESAFANAEAVSGKYVTLPDGKYQGFVSSVSLDVNESFEGCPLEWRIELTVLEGEYKGKTVTKRRTIDADHMGYVKSDLKLLGVEIRNSIAEMGEEATLQSMLDVMVEFQVKNRKSSNGKTYMNIYLNKNLGAMNPFVGNSNGGFAS